MNKAIIKLITFSLLGLAFTACGDSSFSDVKTTPAPVPTVHNPVACNQQQVNVGIIGNSACPYQGSYDSKLGYQSFGVHIDASASFNAGVGFRIDFGWDYNDMCPKIGQFPIFENGRFSRCDSVNPVYAQTDFRGHTQPNTGECTGEQFNPGLTGCRAKLTPTRRF